MSMTTKAETKTMSSMLTKLAITGLVALAAATTPRSLTAQQTPSAKPQPATAKPVAEEEESESAAKKPGQEGIRVHGHWIMDLKDKDGKVIEHRDFQNALQSVGAHSLIRLLTGMVSLDSFAIRASSAEGGLFFSLTPGSAFTASCADPTACFPNMVMTEPTTGGYYSAIVLSGQIVPTVTATIGNVATTISYCYPLGSGTAKSTVAPASCTLGSNVFNNGYDLRQNIFTGTSITPLVVSPGQTLAITVTLSFS